MNHLPANTLAHFAAMPQIKPHDLGGVSCALFADRVNDYRAKLKLDTVQPDAEAVQFYLFNHLAALVKTRFTLNEALPGWAWDVMDAYKDVLIQQGTRLTAYMMLIITRESRHMYAAKDEWWEDVAKKWGDVPKAFHQTIQGKGSSEAANRFLTSPPLTTLKNHAEAIVHMFNHGKFSGGYGGKPWGVIADTLAQFLIGKTTQEMMIDTAYTLAHNNGPMFNKGMLYVNYTGDFLRILDIQRSGQIPELVLETGPKWLTASQTKVFMAAKAHLPDEFGEYVDYYKVEELGGLTNVKAYQIAQDKKYGKKPAKPVVATFNGKKALLIGQFVVAPNVKVKQYERTGA